MSYPNERRYFLPFAVVMAKEGAAEQLKEAAKLQAAAEEAAKQAAAEEAAKQTAAEEAAKQTAAEEAAKQAASEEATRQAAKEATKPKDDSVGELEIKFKQEFLDFNHAVKEIERRARIEVTELNRVRASLRQLTVGAKNLFSARAKRMAEVKALAQMVFSNIRKHKHASLFMNAVDALALGLRDYDEVIRKPMDLERIQHRMDAKDGTGYSNVNEVCDDVRLVFNTFFVYHDAGSDAHKMAKVIFGNFEEEWKAFVEPKMQEEELSWAKKLLEVDAVSAVLNIAERDAFEIVKANLRPLFVNLRHQLEDLKQKVSPPGSTVSMEEEERSELRKCFGRLSGDRLTSAMQIISQENSGFNVNTDEAFLFFNVTNDEVTVNIYGLDSPALWRLYRFVMYESESRPDDALMTTLLSGRKRCPEVETASS